MKNNGPKLYQVFITNNDTTTFEEAMGVISFVFGYDHSKASILANKINDEGKALMGEYILEIAETKVADIDKINELNDFVLEAYIADDEDTAIDQLDLRQLSEKLTKHFESEPTYLDLDDDEDEDE